MFVTRQQNKWFEFVGLVMSFFLVTKKIKLEFIVSESMYFNFFVVPNFLIVVLLLDSRSIIGKKNFERL